MTVSSTTGLEKLYAAKIIKDDSTGATWDTPRYLPGIKEIDLKPKVNSDNQYAENTTWETEEVIDSIEVGIDVIDCEEEDEAYLLGHKVAEGGGVIYNANDKAPEVAILFKANKANKKARYVVLFRGTFSISDEGYKGKEGKSNFQSKKLKASFAPLKFNGDWKYKVDEEQGMTDEKFFKNVIIPKAK